MAEAIGIAASLIGIIQLAGLTVSISYSYISGVKRAPQDLRDLTNELQALSNVIVTLKVHTDENSETPGSVLHMLEKPLETCARELEELLEKLKMKGIIDRLKWPLREKETAQWVERIERHKIFFIFALNTDQILVSREIKTYVQEESVAQRRWRERDESVRLAEKRKKILYWLYEDSFDTKHLEVSNLRQKNTGQWFLKAPEFRQWYEAELPSSLLWGYGIPGAGKTFISSAVINYIECESTTENYGLAYIYFDYQEQNQQKPTLIIASLLKQLATQISYLPTEIETLHRRLERQDKRPNIMELYDALLAVSRLFNRVFFVFDALDECHPERQRKELLPLFHRMAKDSDQIHLFLTSRQYPEDIQDSFCDTAKIEISAQDEDVEMYILEKIDENPRARRLVNQGRCRDRIVTELAECAKGMFLLIQDYFNELLFLLVRFHINYLCQQTTTRGLLAELDKIRSSSSGERPLDPTYDRAMQHVRKQAKSCEVLAIKVLSWLVKARRTLTVEDIRVAVSIEPGLYELDQFDLPDCTTLLDVCAGLIVVDQSNSIKLAHYTVHEYLLKKLIIPDNADFMVAMACTTFLSFDMFSNSKYLTPEINSHPFFCYAVENLSVHLHEVCEDLTTDMVMDFLGRPGSIYCYWNSFFKLDSKTERFDFAGRKRPLHIACAIGHVTAARLLLENGADISARDFNGRTALFLAVFRGHESVVKLLLDQGADPSIADMNGKTPLHMAAAGGHANIALLLLQSGAYFSKTDFEGSALYLAISEGSESVTQLMIENGDDFKSAGNLAINTAVSRGHERIVCLLIEKGADISTPDHRGEVPLHLAASRGHEGIVRLLLERGADINARSMLAWSPLFYAAYAGRENVVRLLIQHGADVTASTRYGWTAFHRAALAGKPATLRALIENGADVLAPVNGGNTALHIAVSEGYANENTVRVLLEKGADINARDKDGKTPLHTAAYAGNRGVFRVLLENGADIEARDSLGQSPLHVAALEGHEEVVRMLLEKGADASARKKDGKSVHDCASRRGRLPVVVLIEKALGMTALDSRSKTV